MNAIPSQLILDKSGCTLGADLPTERRSMFIRSSLDERSGMSFFSLLSILYFTDMIQSNVNGCMQHLVYRRMGYDLFILLSYIVQGVGLGCREHA